MVVGVVLAGGFLVVGERGSGFFWGVAGCFG